MTLILGLNYWWVDDFKQYGKFLQFQNISVSWQNAGMVSFCRIKKFYRYLLIINNNYI